MIRHARSVDALQRFNEAELLINQRDVRRALGLQCFFPLSRAEGVLSFGLLPIGSLVLAFARERAKGLRLVSTENDWRWGSGKEICGALEALLMVTAGRTEALEKLDGPRAGVVADRIGASVEGRPRPESLSRHRESYGVSPGQGAPVLPNIDVGDSVTP
jgi:hypothetical protein